MRGSRRGSGGFTLVASLLMLLLMSGIAIGLLMMVNTEGRVGGNDLENNLAYHDAEGAIEKMTADLANTFQTVQAPSPGQISGLASNPGPPNNDPYVTYTDYSLTPVLNSAGAIATTYHQIQTGPNQGLYAQLMDVNLKATAQRPLGDQVSMMRTVEVALIPVFQFGVFSQGDLGFFNSPNLDFNGRVHTNGDLYLGVAAGNTLNFHDKVTAFGNVIRQVLPNGLSATTYSDTGTVNLVSAAGGCNMMPAGPAGPNCKPIAMNQGSVVLGPTSAQNGTWNNTSTSYYNGWLLDGNYGNPGGTGVRALSLPFTGGGAQPYEIIRRPPAGEALTSAVAQSRLINQGQIRVLLSDTQAALHMADWNGNPAQDIELASLVPNCLLAGGAGWAQNGVVVGGATYYFGEARPATDANFVTPPTFHGTPFPAAPCNTEWPLIDGWLLVEYKNNAGNWVGVTQEWLQLGFARGLDVPNSETGVANPVHPNAILIFQQQADRNGDHQLTNAGDVAINTTGANSQYNWFPINLYDAREGEVRDTVPGNNSCTPNGVMNVVELDLLNLRRWLAGTIGTNGPNVNYQQENGYILYFSDRRGMIADPNALPAPALTGEYGFEDVINSVNVNGNPDGVSEPAMPGKTVSPEDVNGNGRLDTYGAANVGDGFGLNANVNPKNPYLRMASCYTTGRKNRVTGARHGLKLIDGTLGNLPTAPVSTNGSFGGFTVASENPVYIKGNYNTNATDPTWGNPAAADPPHAAAAIIADAVILLSNNWQDNGYLVAPGNAIQGGSFRYPTGATNQRPATTTYYRVAIAAGKNMTFTAPAFSQTPTLYGFGTDGGLHNFLRFLEDWSGQTLNYKGSLVSLYYSTYNTGTFKCCGDAVYHPPVRNYVFDPLFAQPQNMPPGTPMFRDVDNISYRQDFTPH